MREQINRVRNWKQFLNESLEVTPKNVVGKMTDFIEGLKILNEAVGVPEGIELSARKVYDDIIRFLENNPEYATNKQKFEIRDNYGFSDYYIDMIEVNIEHIEAIIDKSQIGDMGFRASTMREGGRLKSIASTTFPLQITIARPKNDLIKYDDVMSLLKTDAPKNISKIAHELKHGYDGYKNIGGLKLGDAAEYNVFYNSRFGNEVIDKFMFDTYFAIRYESLVRPSQLYTLAKEKGITKKDFINFLEETDLYKTLIEIANKSYEDFRGQLKENMDFINKVIKNFQNVTIPKDDEGKIDLFLRGILGTLSVKMMENFIEKINNNNPVDGLLSMFGNVQMDPDEDEKLIKDFIKKLSKYTNREVEFFEYMIEENQNKSRQAIKKLGSIYSILPDGS